MSLLEGNLIGLSDLVVFINESELMKIEKKDSSNNVIIFRLTILLF
jgi:hypothetical protein